MPLVSLSPRSVDTVNLRLEIFLEDVFVLKMFRSCYYLQKHCIYVVVNITNRVNMSVNVQMLCANTVLFLRKGLGDSWNKSCMDTRR